MTPNLLDMSARLLYETAQKRGIQCELFEGERNMIYMSKGKASWYTYGSRTSLQSSVGRTIAISKHLIKLVLQHFNLPTSPAVTVHTIEDLENIAKLNFPLVMKPVEGAHGREVVTNIRSLEAARQHYSPLKKGVLFEEQLQGTEYRVVCVGFRFVAAAFRKPAFVVGDGQHTIQELIELKNQHPWRGSGHSNILTSITIDSALEGLLSEQDFHLQSVPKTNQEVVLRSTANLSTGGEAWDVTDEVSPENRLLFERIAKACDLNSVGIDVMCQNLQDPIENQPKAGIIEVNGSPGLRMHHYPLQGQPRDVAGAILDMVEHALL